MLPRNPVGFDEVKRRRREVEVDVRSAVSLSRKLRIVLAQTPQVLHKNNARTPRVMPHRHGKGGGHGVLQHIMNYAKLFR